jgi:hypothetical protein
MTVMKTERLDKAVDLIKAEIREWAETDMHPATIREQIAILEFAEVLSGTISNLWYVRLGMALVRWEKGDEHVV